MAGGVLLFVIIILIIIIIVEQSLQIERLHSLHNFALGYPY